MSEKENSSNNQGGLFQALEGLLHLNKFTEKVKRERSPTSGAEIKNRVLLKIERAEIMSAMINIREGKDPEGKNHRGL